MIICEGNDLAMWFTPDPAEQFANPYLAMGNNPVMFTDPDGEFIFAASFIIGAMIGSFTGAVVAGFSGASNGQVMSSFLFGGISGGVGGNVAASGIPFAKTLAIAAASTISSVGNSEIYGSDVSTSFGAFSVNWENGKVNTFNKDNSFLENFGYSLGALTNLSDGVELLDNIKAIRRANMTFEERLATQEYWKAANRGTYIGANGTGDPEIARNYFGFLEKNKVDKLAYSHDVTYYNSGADGFKSALLNTKMLKADMTLLRGAQHYAGMQFSSGVRGAFIPIIGLKYMIVYSYLYPRLDNR